MLRTPAPPSVALSLDSILEILPKVSPNDRALIEKAYHVAEAAHAGQTRKSGEPFFTHCVSVAMILAEMHLDAEAIAAALLHDTIEDTHITSDDIRAEFGGTILHMVESVTKITKLPISEKNTVVGRRSSTVSREQEYFRKMLLTMGDDVRVVIIKLADRLHNMRTLGYMKPEKQIAIAQETLDIFAPLANRLGIWQIKWELEDLCLRYLEPNMYKDIARKIDERRADREAYMTRITKELQDEIARQGIEKAHVSGRPKHIYSIYNKMKRKELPFEQIYDVRAIRVIVPTKAECYQALGIVHNKWHPVPNEFDDYIASPKDNFYQSLHTAVVDNNGKIVEVQIRTMEMHEHAEYGIAAHWRYKEGGSTKHDENFQKRLTYLRRLMEFGADVKEDPEAFLDTMRSEVFQDRVYVFTPEGDIVDLPTGATPIDFAYHIHTDIGHRCRGAKVHGKLVNLNYKLSTGDQVQILTSKRGGPSMDWLNDDLGFVATQRARSKIRHWFRKQNREKHISMGREGVERELRRLGVLDSMTFEEVAKLLDHENVTDFFAAVGAGEVSAAQISNRVLDELRKRQIENEEAGALLKAKVRELNVTDSTYGVKILGTGGLLTNLAQCCNPMAGEQIVGYVTRGRGVTIHRRDCPNIIQLMETERDRLIDVSWGGTSSEQRYPVPVEIVAYDREGLIRDISTVIADERVNILDVSVTTRQDIATIHLTLEISNNRQLRSILGKIGMIRSVTETYRRNIV